LDFGPEEETMFRFHELQRVDWLSVGVLGLSLVLAGGCMQIPRAPATPPHWMGSPSAPTGDPFLNAQPQVAPVQQPQPTLAPSEPTPATEEFPQPTFDEDYSAPTPVESFRPVPTPADLPDLPPSITLEPEVIINPDVQPPRLEAPTIVPQAVTVPTTLGLEVKAPGQNQVGEVSVFEVTIQNKGDQPAKNVMIESRFEEGFTFPGSTDRQVNQTLGTLAAGESRDLKLSLRSDKPGYHCVEFALLATGTKAITKKVCVEYRDSDLSLEVNGPVKRMVGGNAEWNLTITSRDFLPASGAEVVLDYDSTYLKPLGGSEGATQELGKITWPLGTLEVAERVELQVEFECLMPVDSTCLAFQVSADGQPQEKQESCLAIDRRTGALEVDLQDTVEPIKTGEELDYVITVTNRELGSVHDVQVTATLPAMFRASSTEVREGQQVLTAVRANVEGSVIRFDSVDVLAPDAKLTYRIKVKALQAGTDRLLVSVTSDDATGGKIRLEEVSTVVE
jgi:hypothetical protein